MLTVEKEKVHRKSLNLSSGYKIVLNHKTRHRGSLNNTKPVTIGASVISIPILSYVAANSAWDPRRPHQDATSSLTLPPLLFSSLPFSSQIASRPAAGDWGGGRRGEAGEEEGGAAMAADGSGRSGEARR